ncbi:hypothetical protein GCM10010430_19260 [Kitasatospora cystarginea]|uniref:Helix-turn-helix domain-containing protein n=1 Tax=Kitasatospora cystarginea TaxID=58350 RepID=A0ABP5QL85_9ACTN
MHVHFIAPTRYVRASHDIIRHPRLKATAKSLLLWALSLPPGSRDTILTISHRMPEGREAVSGARGQLIAEGFLHVRRYQHPTKGTWATEVMVTSVPLTDREEVAAAWAAAGAEAAVPPTDRNPALGGQRTRGVGTSPKGENSGENTSLPAPPPPEPKSTGAPAPDAAAAEAARLLCGLGARDRRLRLGLSEALELAPLACEWLARDGGQRGLQEALLTGLPDRVHAPVAFLRTRLERKMPAPPAPVPLPPARQECRRCQAPVPGVPGVAGVGVCGSCTGSGRARTPDPASVDRNRRGAARARDLLRAARTAQPVGC